jgi:hypothetical protein
MPVRRIGYACPLCDQSGVTSHLYEAPPALATRCETDGSHVWTDSDQLRNLMPRILHLPRVVHQAPRVELPLQVPEQLSKNLQAKYGANLNDALIGVLQYAAQPQFLFLGSDDLERIQEKLGAQLNNGSELYGALFQMGEKIESLKSQLQQAMRASTIRASGTGVLLDLGENMQNAAAKADEYGMTIEDLLSNYVKDALANGWVMA